MNKIINDKIREGAKNIFPKEYCSIIYVDRYGIVQIKELDNISNSPEKDFEFDSLEILKIEQERGDVLAICHSHPESNNGIRFSTKDIEYSEELGIHYYLYDVKSDSFKIYEPTTYEHKPLENRVFVLGFWDCYTLCRDYYKEKGVKMGYYLPPKDKIYYSNEDDFERFAEKEGFFEVPFKEAKEGDILLFKIGKSRYGNHIGIYMNNMRILHQTKSNISKVSELDGRWMSFFYKSFRHKSFM